MADGVASVIASIATVASEKEDNPKLRVSWDCNHFPQGEEEYCVSLLRELCGDVFVGDIATFASQELNLSAEKLRRAAGDTIIVLLNLTLERNDATMILECSSQSVVVRGSYGVGAHFVSVGVEISLEKFYDTLSCYVSDVKDAVGNQQHAPALSTFVAASEENYSTTEEIQLAVVAVAIDHMRDVKIYLRNLEAMNALKTLSVLVLTPSHIAATSQSRFRASSSSATTSTLRCGCQKHEFSHQEICCAYPRGIFSKSGIYGIHYVVAGAENEVRRELKDMRTQYIDVDSKGRKCKERQMQVLYESVLNLRASESSMECKRFCIAVVESADCWDSDPFLASLAWALLPEIRQLIHAGVWNVP